MERQLATLLNLATKTKAEKPVPSLKKQHFFEKIKLNLNIKGIEVVTIFHQETTKTTQMNKSSNPLMCDLQDRTGQDVLERVQV